MKDPCILINSVHRDAKLNKNRFKINGILTLSISSREMSLENVALLENIGIFDQT